MILPLSHNFQVQHDPELRLMRFQWVGGPNSRGLRAGMRYSRDLVEKLHPHFVLVDFAGMPPVEMRDELWMSLHWFPRVSRRPLRGVAVMYPPTQLHNQMAVEAMLWVGRRFMQYQLQVFKSVPAAYDWFTGGDTAAGLRLEAEWEAAKAPLLLSI
ncbi:hypothetical protein [Hymenobacter convexus]|uniref:hypothetical protein n=1 Tax=Hymenobacter sp. CA1UV-4 TaxID=3063782 RepID=UPI002712ABEB|nr:hypothetical protein [Hymenobacter sp. CA1UV-4]MDO7850914.1 hypothetical protein [Hymenobacter sp. CA1UV-4]